MSPLREEINRVYSFRHHPAWFEVRLERFRHPFSEPERRGCEVEDEEDETNPHCGKIIFAVRNGMHSSKISAPESPPNHCMRIAFQSAADLCSNGWSAVSIVHLQAVPVAFSGFKFHHRQRL
jgi:hypothetical protein